MSEPLSESEVAILQRLHRALNAAGSELLIVGGQAARLMQFHELAHPIDWEALRTKDIDLAAPEPLRGPTHDLHGALVAEGFKPSLLGDDDPPLVRYVHGPFEVELLVPERPRRHAKAVVEIHGARAQVVANLEVLLFEPSVLEVPDVGRLPVVSPGPYVLQKLLTLRLRRSLAKKGKDTLYVHDTLQRFAHGGVLRPPIVEQTERAWRTLSKRQTTVARETHWLLTNPSGELIREAARQALGRGKHGAEAIALFLQRTLAQLLPR